MPALSSNRQPMSIARYYSPVGAITCPDCLKTTTPRG